MKRKEDVEGIFVGKKKNSTVGNISIYLESSTRDLSR